MDGDNLKPTELIYTDELKVGWTLILIEGSAAKAEIVPVEVQRVRVDNKQVSAIVLDENGSQRAVTRGALQIVRILKRS